MGLLGIKLYPHIQCVFAFFRTHVIANLNATSPAYCIHVDQISDYVTKGRGCKPSPLGRNPLLAPVRRIALRMAEPRTR